MEEIETIDIEAPDFAVRHVADEAKYDPKNRETADHSLPYMLAVALVDGLISPGLVPPGAFPRPGPAPRDAQNQVESHRGDGQDS